jgi:hypothetical protein
MIDRYTRPAMGAIWYIENASRHGSRSSWPCAWLDAGPDPDEDLAEFKPSRFRRGGILGIEEMGPATSSSPS